MAFPPEAFSYLAFLDSLKQEGGIEAVVDFALDPLGTGEGGIISPAVAKTLLEEGDQANINDPEKYAWGSDIGHGGLGPRGKDQIVMREEYATDSSEEEDDSSENENENDDGSPGDSDMGDPDDGSGGGFGGGDDGFIWEDPFGDNPDAGFFDAPPVSSLNKAGVPKFSDADLRKARLLLEAELRMAGFDSNAIGRLIEDWVIPRLTGTFVDPETGVTMLAPDTPLDIMPELYEREEFRTRFPGYHARLDAGYNAIPIQDYLTYETRFKELLTQYGLDTILNADDKSVSAYIGDLIAGNISIEQLDRRVNQGVGAVLNAPPEVLSQYERWYGADGENALLATFLDPNADLFKLGEQVQAATAAGYARKILGPAGALTQEMAEEIADLDYTNQQLQNAYTALAQREALFKEKLGEANIDIGDEGVSYALNLDQDVVKRIEKRRERRLSAFSGGGGASTRNAITGFGASNA